MAAHAYLKNEFTEDKKCQNLMSWLIIFIIIVRWLLFARICIVVSSIFTNWSSSFQILRVSGVLFHYIIFFFFLDIS